MSKMSYDATDRYKHMIENMVKNFDANSVDMSLLNDDEKRDNQVRVIEKQAEYIWLRVNLEEEIPEIVSGDLIRMTFTPTGESIEFVMGSYDKMGLYRDENGVIVQEAEDDFKTMCLLVDLEVINKNSDHIPWIRTFFRSSRYYTPELLRKEDIILECVEKGIIINYKRINF